MQSKIAYNIYCLISFSELCLWDIEDGLCLQINVIPGNHTALYVSEYLCQF